jgi:pimeloyl-ACP methyl ester carboxylesterase
MTALIPAPSTSRFIETNGVKVHYLDYGTAGRRPMVCVHGGAAHAHWFDFVAPGFTPDHHVFAPDLRGHGDSAWADPQTYSFETHAEDIHAFLEKLDLSDVVLIGHSMGGMISLLYATAYPGRVSRLIIVDSTMLMPMDRVLRMREFSARPGKSYATQDELSARFRLEPAKSQLAAPEVIHRMATHSGRQDGEGRWQLKADRRVYTNFRQVPGVPLFEKIKIPALVIKGEHSKRFGPEVLAEVRAKAPQVQSAEVPASDHHITLENPQGFVEAVRKFLRT